ncbi:MAG: hypothetical protein ACLP0J_13375 [Solirubrobacteraceae bacterium]
MKTRLTANTPRTLQTLMVLLVVLSVAWGALGGWAIGRHASAASGVAGAGERLNRDAQGIYQSISDADVTATTTFLSGPQPPLASLQRFQTDVAMAAAGLSRLREAAGADQQLVSALSALAAGLPVYTGYVAQAQSDSALGYPLTGGSFMQVASEEAHLVLLPAARTIYARENAALAGQIGEATGLPSMIAILVLAVIIGILLLRTQRWLTRVTHRVFNYGLVVGSAALVVSVVWLAVAFTVARTDLVRGNDHGSRPATILAHASIDVQQARGDEILNLISRSGDASFKQNFESVRDQLGPGPGTLLASAAAASGPQAAQVMAAADDAPGWYASNEQVYRLDLASAYAAETNLVIGSGPGSSAAGFAKLESDIGRAISGDLGTFQTDATAGSDAFGPLEGVVIVTALLMALGSAWGLSRRIAEYR